MGIITLIVVLLIMRVPYLGTGAKTVNVLVHEFGHALGTKLTLGRVNSIVLNSDLSGEAHSSVRGKFSMFVASLMGYPFASIMSVWFIGLLREGHYNAVMNIILGIAIICLLLWIRNGYGVLWAVLYIALIFIVKNNAGDGLYQFFVKLNVGILFVEATYSSLILVWARRLRRDILDTQVLKFATGIPEGFWVYLIAGVGVVTFFSGIGYWM